MQEVIRKIIIAVESIYRDSPHYVTVGQHVSRVARYAREFAEAMDARPSIAEAGGWLHDLGAAMHGRELHHETGVKEASLILLECDCPLEFVGPIISTVHTHRGSQRIAFKIPEAICVAAADSKDHFLEVGELWKARMRQEGCPIATRESVSQELERDWGKIVDPKIRKLLEEVYQGARKKLLEIFSEVSSNRTRRRVGR